MYNSAFGTFVTNDMISPCWGDTIRLNYNLGLSKIATKASLCMTPIFDPSIMYEYPQFGAFGNGLLNPIMAINQTMQSFGGGWNNGWNFGNFQNWFNTNPWTTGGGGGNSSKLTDSEREELAKVKDDVELVSGKYYIGKEQIKVEPKKEEPEEEKIPEGKMKCSGCGEIIETKYTFCPLCGAKNEPPAVEGEVVDNK